MADTTKKVSELETASQVDSTDYVMLSQGSSQSGFASVKATILAIAQKIITGINFTSALETESKTIAGAINEVAQGGGGSSTFAGLSDVDIDDTTLANGQVPKWNSTTEKWENGNAGGGSGGHTILDDSGTSLAQEDDLQFKGTYSHDDSTNGKTVVEITREMTQAEYNLLSADEKKGIIRITDDNYVCEGSEVKYAEGVSVKDKIDEIDGKTAVDIPYSSESNVNVYQKLGWSLIGTLTGESGNSINMSGYTEYVFVPKVNGVFRYNSYHALKMSIWYGETGVFHMSCYENSTTGWHGRVNIASDGTATLTNALLNGWSTVTVDVFGKP